MFRYSAVWAVSCSGCMLAESKLSHSVGEWARNSYGTKRNNAYHHNYNIACRSLYHRIHTGSFSLCIALKTCCSYYFVLVSFFLLKIFSSVYKSYRARGSRSFNKISAYALNITWLVCVKLSFSLSLSPLGNWIFLRVKHTKTQTIWHALFLNVSLVLHSPKSERTCACWLLYAISFIFFQSFSLFLLWTYSHSRTNVWYRSATSLSASHSFNSSVFFSSITAYYTFKMCFSIVKMCFFFLRWNSMTFSYWKFQNNTIEENVDWIITLDTVCMCKYKCINVHAHRYLFRSVCMCPLLHYLLYRFVDISVIEHIKHSSVNG